MRALVPALFLLAACGTTAPAVDLPAPWDFAEGGVAGGTVQSVTDEELHVTYETAPKSLEDDWIAALKAKGYTADHPSGLPGLMRVDFYLDDATVEMLVTRQGGRADVLLTR